MSTTLESPPATKASLLRRWFPVLAVGLAVLTLVIVWRLPEGSPERLVRSMINFGVVSGTLLAVFLWLMFFAPFRRAARLCGVAAFLLLLGGFVGSVMAGLVVVDFDGDLVPRFRLGRWFAQGPISSEAVAEDLSGNGPNDWPEYRGRKRDGIVAGPRLATDWSGKAPLWRHAVGEGHSSFAIAGNIAIMLEQRGGEEAVVCYHVPTGQQVWAYSYPAQFKELMGGKGPRSTPTIVDGEVFTLGATGKLVCLDARTGKEKWGPVDVLKDNANVRWGMSGSPLVFDNLVVVNPGAQTEQAAGTLAAYDRKTGKHLWSSGRAPAGYSSPMLTTLAGKRQVLLLDGAGLSGYDPADKGKELWRFAWPVQEQINAAEPVLLGDDRVLISSGYDAGSAALQIKPEGDKWTVTEVWRSRRMRCKFSSPILYQGHLYGLDDGTLVCLDAQSGKRKWRGERYGHGQMLLTNGQLVITSEEGALALVEATPEQYRELTRMQAIDGRTWNLPALSNGLVLVRNHLEAACYDLKDPSAGPSPTRSGE